MSAFNSPFGGGGGTGTGDVAGPASAVNDNLAVFDGVTGKLVKDGGVKVSGLEPVIATKNTAFNKDFGTAAGTAMEGDDARLAWLYSSHAISGNQSGDVTITPANGHRQSVTIDGAVTALICALSATYPAIVLEITTTGDFALDLDPGERAGTVDISVVGTAETPAVITFEYDVTTLVTGDKLKITLPISATSEIATDTYEYTLVAAYDETTLLAALNDDANWTGTLSGVFSVVAGDLVFTYTADGEQSDLGGALLGYTLAIWTVWKTDGGGAVVLPDTGTCIMVLQLSANGTTKYAYLAATEVS